MFCRARETETSAHGARGRPQACQAAPLTTVLRNLGFRDPMPPARAVIEAVRARWLRASGSPRYQQHTMDARAYEMMAETEERHWWWSGRRAILRAILRELYANGSIPPGTLYDLGCGVGSNLPVLAEFGAAVGIDGSELAVASAHKRGRGNVHLADLSRGISALGEYGPGSGSVVLFADVLEHLDDEGPALDLAEYLLADGGALIITVPAFPQLWGPSDVFNHHRRRYTRKTLGAVVGPRFAISRMSYFNFFLFPTIAVARAAQNVARRPGHEEIGLPPRPVNHALRLLFSAESLLLRRADLPFGVSLLCVARKRSAAHA